MKGLLHTALCALGASAAIIPRASDTCCFSLTVSGVTESLYSTVNELSDGELNIGGDSLPIGFCMTNGQITDACGRGCYMAPSTTQFICQDGAVQTGNFSFFDSGLSLNDNGVFYACPYDAADWKIYRAPLNSSGLCIEIYLSITDSTCYSSPGACPLSSGSAVSSASVLSTLASPTFTGSNSAVTTTPIVSSVAPAFYSNSSVPVVISTSVSSAAAVSTSTTSVPVVANTSVVISSITAVNTFTSSIPPVTVTNVVSSTYTSFATPSSSAITTIATTSAPASSSAEAAAISASESAASSSAEAAALSASESAASSSAEAAAITASESAASSAETAAVTAGATTSTSEQCCAPTWYGEASNSQAWDSWTRQHWGNGRGRPDYTKSWYQPNTYTQPSSDETGSCKTDCSPTWYTATPVPTGIASVSTSAPYTDTSSGSAIVSPVSGSLTTSDSLTTTAPVSTSSSEILPASSNGTFTTFPETPSASATSSSLISTLTTFPGTPSASATSSSPVSITTTVSSLPVSTSISTAPTSAPTTVTTAIVSTTISTPASSTTATACSPTLSGAYQTPQLIIPISSTSPNTSYGTQYDATINSTTSTIFNFDIPDSYANNTCSVVFLFPEQSELITSSYTYSESGGLEWRVLDAPATENTTWNNAPGVAGTLPGVTLLPGNNYVLSSGPCAAGDTVTIEMVSVRGAELEWFEDENAPAIGLYIVAC